MPTRPVAFGAPSLSPYPLSPSDAARVVRCDLPAPGAARIGLTVEPLATVAITGWDEERVLVQVAPEGEGRGGGVEVVCPAGDGGALWVHVYAARAGAGPASALRIDVRVPRRFAVALTARRSAVLVSGVDGRVTRAVGRAMEGAA